ncbi:FadR/GntR family transcriptional regulator [Oceanicella actignis]|uniref:FadR/GntR family transcriptional regulator n=1 Tax=Oceanicella actignis TaxID=1189325 RepID=UPI0011E6E082|nr:GntR family transcriptional regulator [Oceanicella actignis]TYO90725.1 GntR family transcriptional regulator [Oceanicella actignis]
MSIEYQPLTREGLGVQIADAIREAIVEGRLMVDERLPGETELAERFGVSRATVREALKRLAAQNLIRTRRGPAGGAFVNRLSRDEAQETIVTVSRLMIGMNEIDFESAAEARFALEAACLPLAAERREDAHLAAMRAEVAAQRDPEIDDEAFCASDVRFHCAVAEAAGNPMLAMQICGAVEAMQPLMNMLTYRLRDRKAVAALHEGMADALEARDAAAARGRLDELAAYAATLAAARRARAG